MSDDFPMCAFHPDRRAGVVCQRCDNPICPACMTQASVGFHCPNCVKQGRQKVVQGRAAFGGGFQPILTYVLIAINVAVYLVQRARGDIVLGIFNGRTVVDNKTVVQYSLNGYAIAAHHQWYRVITGAFLHANILHIGLNMLALWYLGRVVEQLSGRTRYGLIYAVSLVAGSAGALLLDPNAQTVGASGAIYGLFGALVLLFRAREIDIWRSGLGLTILLNFVFTLSVPGISLGGHLGGFVGGLGAAWVVIEAPKRLRNPKQALAMVAALVPVLFVVAMLAASRWTQPVFTG